MDALCAMMELGGQGELTGSLDALARICRCTVQEMSEAIEEIKLRNVGEVIDRRNGEVTQHNGEITLINRRMRREFQSAKFNAERQKRFREANARRQVDAMCNTKVTAKKSEVRSQKSEKDKTLSAGADGTSEIPLDHPAKTKQRISKRKPDAEHEPDPRHRPIVECLQRHYAASNLGRKMPWDGLGAKRLATLLASNPSRPLEDFTLCVEHRFASEVNRSESPIQWIARLLDYFGAPLNKFKQPIGKLLGAPMPDESPSSEPGPDEIGEPIPPDILDQMVLSKSRQFVDTWLSPARYERDGEIIRLYAPNHLFVEWLSGQALAELRTCFQCKLVEVRDVRVECKRRSSSAGRGLPGETGAIPPGNGSGPAIRGSIEEHASIKLTAG